MKRKANRSVMVFEPVSSAVLLGGACAEMLMATAARKGRVLVWPTARRLPIPERPGYPGGSLLVAQTAPRPGWKRNHEVRG